MYINDYNNHVPDKKILTIPHSMDIANDWHDEIIFPLKGYVKRDWFTAHFYYCLPLNIGNQYGFGIKSLRNFDVEWAGGERPAKITFTDDQNKDKQLIDNHFGSGIITFQNRFALKTQPGINLMTIQPPNLFIPGLHVMTGVVETDQIRRDFSFNIKITNENQKISVRNGDIVAAFMPIPRAFVESFSVEPALNYFDKDIIQNEMNEAHALGLERHTVDRQKPHAAGRRYFNGVHTDNSKYPNHQKRII